MKQTEKNIAEVSLEKLDRIEAYLGIKPNSRKSSNTSPFIEDVKSCIESARGSQPNVENGVISQDEVNHVEEILQSFLIEFKTMADGTNYKVDSMAEFFQEVLTRMHETKREPPQKEQLRTRWRGEIWSYFKGAWKWPIWRNHHFWGVFVIFLMFGAMVGSTLYINHRRKLAEIKLYWLDRTLVNDTQYSSARFQIEMFINENGVDSTYEYISSLRPKKN